MRKRELSSSKKPASARRAKTPTEPSKQSGHTVIPSPFEVVAEKAYFMYLNAGSPGGLDVHHWLKAEAEVGASHGGQSATG